MPSADNGKALPAMAQNRPATSVMPTPPLHLLVPAVHEIVPPGHGMCPSRHPTQPLLQHYLPALLYVYLQVRLAEPGPVAAVDEAWAADLMFAENIASSAQDQRQQLEAVRARWGWDAAVFGVRALKSYP